MDLCYRPASMALAMSLRSMAPPSRFGHFDSVKCALSLLAPFARLHAPTSGTLKPAATMSPSPIDRSAAVQLVTDAGIPTTHMRPPTRSRQSVTLWLGHGGQLSWAGSVILPRRSSTSFVR